MKGQMYESPSTTLLLPLQLGLWACGGVREGKELEADP